MIINKERPFEERHLLWNQRKFFIQHILWPFYPHPWEVWSRAVDVEDCRPIVIVHLSRDIPLKSSMSLFRCTMRETLDYLLGRLTVVWYLKMSIWKQSKSWMVTMMIYFHVGLNEIIAHIRCLEIFSSIPCPAKRVQVKRIQRRQPRPKAGLNYVGNLFLKP